MTAHKPGDPTTLNRLYGRSQGKPLRAGQQSLIDDLLPKIAVPAEGEATATRLFGSDRPLHFEIGFGGGEHLADQSLSIYRRFPTLASEKTIETSWLLKTAASILLDVQPPSLDPESSLGPTS